MLPTFDPVSIISDGILLSQESSSPSPQCTSWMEFTLLLLLHSCFLSSSSFITFVRQKRGEMLRRVSFTIKFGNFFFVSIQERVPPFPKKRTIVLIIRARQILASTNPFTCWKSSFSMAIHPILQCIEKGRIVHYRSHYRDKRFQCLSARTQETEIRMAGLHPFLGSKGIPSSSHFPL